MAPDSVAYRRVGGDEVAERMDELADVFREVFQAPPYEYDEEHVRLFRDSLEDHRTVDGFALVEARDDKQLVGFSLGIPLKTTRQWWFDMATDVDPELMEEYAGRTFAVIELLVLPQWQGQGVAGRLHDLLLQDRPEQRATLTVEPDADVAQSFYAKRGWRKVARKYNPLPDNPLFDVLLKDLQ